VTKTNSQTYLPGLNAIRVLAMFSILFGHMYAPFGDWGVADGDRLWLPELYTPMVTIFDTTGISERNLNLRNEERRKVLEEVLPPAILADYDKFAFPMHQMDNLRKHPWAYKLVWVLERVLNRLDNKNFMLRKKHQ